VKVYFKDIISTGWLGELLKQSKIGAKFLACNPPDYFVFFYNYVEKKSEIEIVNFTKVYEPNELIYKQQYYSKSEYTGCLQEPFDTNNFLFYLLLKNCCKTSSLSGLPEFKDWENKLDDLFLKYKYQDLQRAKNAADAIQIKSTYEISGRSSYFDAINSILFIFPNSVNGMQLVTDMIDGAVTKKYGHSFYGSVLKKIVISLPNPDGGLIAEEDGMMRYMFVGERSFKNDTLDVAKNLLRSGIDLDEIYIQTGWYWNKYDRKWRYKIPTKDFTYKIGSLNTVEYKGNTYDVLIPESFRENIPYLVEKLIELSDENSDSNAIVLDLLQNGYDGKLSDLFEYDDLYKIYPEFRDKMTFFIKSIGKQTALKDYKFYNADTGIKHICLISNSDRFDLDKVRTIAAHEIQHAIQKIEGFGNGGNPSFASMIVSSGSGEFRKFFFLLTSFLEEVIKKASLIPLTKWVKLADDLDNEKEKPKIKYIKDGKEIEEQLKLTEKEKLVKTIREKANSPESINAYSQVIAYQFLYLTYYYTNSAEIISNFLKDEISYDCSSLFDICKFRIKNTIEKNYFLKQKGWSDIDIRQLNFRAYQYLVGEFESRYIQQTVNLREELVSYFRPYTSETINPDEVNVYGNDNVFSDVSSKFGIELKDNKYILHTKKNKDAPYMILHEYGHILYDMMKDEDSTEIEFGYDKNVGINVEEYFCESFVDYIVRKELDKGLSDAVLKSFTVKNYNNYDLLFDNFFAGKEIVVNEEQLSKMLLFINQILNYD
jgi:hypothetical protein